MLSIKLTRKGRKNQPFFRIVVIPQHSPPRGGRIVEDVGYLDPITKRKSLNKERIVYWLSRGAKPSDSVFNLLVSEGIIKGEKINLFKKSKKEKEQVISEKKVTENNEKAPQESQENSSPNPQS